MIVAADGVGTVVVVVVAGVADGVGVVTVVAAVAVVVVAVVVVVVVVADGVGVVVAVVAVVVAADGVVVVVVTVAPTHFHSRALLINRKRTTNTGVLNTKERNIIKRRLRMTKKKHKISYRNHNESSTRALEMTSSNCVQLEGL